MGGMSDAAGGWARSVRDLMYVAMAVFVVTIAIGIVNGLDLYEFNRDQLLTHVHSGTIGWITLGLVAASIWLARSVDRRLVIALAVLVPVYVAAFYSGSMPARAITGTLLLVAVLWLFVWAWQTALRDGGLPALAVALGITSFTYGAIIGVLIQVQFATGSTIFPADSDFIGAHAATMVFSYLVLAAMGLIEWRAKGTTGRPMLGLVQVGALFVGGALLALTLLFLSTNEAAVQAVGGIDLLLNLIAVVLFVVRVLPATVRTDWLADSGGRYLGAAAIWVVVAIAIFMYLISLFIANPDPSAIPPGVLVASDHAVFIGVITNLLLGVGWALTADRRMQWPAAAQLAFWGINAGLIVFIAGLVSATQVMKQIGAPVMGISILVALALLALRLRESSLAAGTETMAPATAAGT